MFQMCLNYIWTLFNNVFHNLFFIIGLSLAFLNTDCSLRAVTKACTQTITAQLTHQTCLVINNLNSTFRTVWYAYTASVAPVFININYFPFHNYLPIPLLKKILSESYTVSIINMR